MVASAIHTTRMLSFYPYPDFVFMTGICAGRRKKGIVLGDVIVANMAFDYEVGKKTLDRFEPEMAANKPDARMVQWLNDFHSKNVELEQFIQIPRPPSLRFQKVWVLFKLYEKNKEGVEWPLTDQDFAGEEAQVDYGTGPWMLDPPSGKYRRTQWAGLATAAHSR